MGWVESSWVSFGSNLDSTRQHQVESRGTRNWLPTSIGRVSFWFGWGLVSSSIVGIYKMSSRSSKCRQKLHFFSSKTTKFLPESSNFIKSCQDLFEIGLILSDFLYSFGWVGVARVLEKQICHSTRRHQFLELETHRQLIGASVQTGIGGAIWSIFGLWLGLETSTFK